MSHTAAQRARAAVAPRAPGRDEGRVGAGSRPEDHREHGVEQHGTGPPPSGVAAPLKRPPSPSPNHHTAIAHATDSASAARHVRLPGDPEGDDESAFRRRARS